MGHKRQNLDAVSIIGTRGKNARPFDWVEIAEWPTPQLYPWLADFSGDDPRCFIYVIAPEGKWPVKVGISKSPRRRLSDLQGANWKRLKVEVCAWAETKTSAFALEQYVHSDYSDRGKWLLGEWIDARPDDAKERIEWAAMALNIGVNFGIPEDKISEVQRKIDSMWPTNARHEAIAKRTEIGY